MKINICPFCLKTKIKSYEEKVITNFHDDRIAKEGSHSNCLSVILIDSVFRMSKNNYSEVFSEECKDIVKEKKMTKYITDDLQISSNDFDEESSEEED